MAKGNLIFGRHPILEAIESGLTFEKLFVQKGINWDDQKKVLHYCHTNLIPVQMVPIHKLNRLTAKNHQGVVAVNALIQYYKLEDIIMKTYEDGQDPFICLLDEVSDVRNFGAIARSALSYGVHAIVIPLSGSAQINADAMKASAGALNSLPVCRTKSMEHTIKYLTDSGIPIYASALTGAKKMTELDFNGPCAIMHGSEGMGIHPKHLRKVTEIFFIPMKRDIDSLNVSVAAGISFYHRYVNVKSD